MEMVLQLFRCAQEETITFFRVLKCALDHFSLVLPDNAAQIIAVQCHEEESTFPRRETEHRCQKSEEISEGAFLPVNKVSFRHGV